MGLLKRALVGHFAEDYSALKQPQGKKLFTEKQSTQNAFVYGKTIYIEYVCLRRNNLLRISMSTTKQPTWNTFVYNKTIHIKYMCKW